MFGFDKMFDFNRDGKLDSWERAAPVSYTHLRAHETY